MKKKWIAGLCGAACMALLFMPANVTMVNSQMGAGVVYAAATDTQYDGTLTIPVTDSIQPVETVSLEGTLTDVNTEDVYLLDVKESAITLTIEGITDRMSNSMELQTLMGNTLKSCTLNSYSPMIDTTTGTCQESINNYYLAKGQYLCRISRNYGEGQFSYKVKAHSVDAAETKTISVGKKYLAYGKNVQYKKITIKEPGKLTIKCNVYDTLSEAYDTQLVNNLGREVVLCNKNKKELTKESGTTTSKSYGVKKGTYYIKIFSGYSRDYAVYSTAFSKANPAGSTKKSAKTITKKYKNYVMESGSSSAQWFKFSLKKAKKLKVYVSNLTDGALTVEVYDRKSKSPSSLYLDKDKYINIQRVQGNKVIKWEKGTYYIKITKRLNNSQGGTVKVRIK